MKTLHLGPEGRKYASKCALLPCGQGTESVENLAQLLDNIETQGRIGYWDLVKGTYSGNDVTIITTGIGGPSAAIVVEELAYMGVENFIRVGTCGGIKQGIRPGDIVVPQRAKVGYDGVSASYNRYDKNIRLDYAMPDRKLTEEMIKIARSKDVKLDVGTVLTDDGFYNITDHWTNHKEDLKALSDGGILGVEMECSSIFNVARHLGVKAAAILVADNNLFEGIFKEYGAADRYKVAGKIALEVLKL
jgi:uridine phosphorylase